MVTVTEGGAAGYFVTVAGLHELGPFIPCGNFSKVAGLSAVVSASGLGLTFETNDGPVLALTDVNLNIEKGEFVSFIGPSGCGKTTFLRVIADLETADRRHHHASTA